MPQYLTVARKTPIQPYSQHCTHPQLRQPERSPPLGPQSEQQDELSADTSATNVPQVTNSEQANDSEGGQSTSPHERLDDTSADSPWCASGAPLSEDLARVVESWPDLPQHIRQTILTLVEVRAPKAEQPDV